MHSCLVRSNTRTDENMRIHIVRSCHGHSIPPIVPFCSVMSVVEDLLLPGHARSAIEDYQARLSGCAAVSILPGLRQPPRPGSRPGTCRAPATRSPRPAPCACRRPSGHNTNSQARLRTSLSSLIMRLSGFCIGCTITGRIRYR